MLTPLRRYETLTEHHTDLTLWAQQCAEKNDAYRNELQNYLKEGQDTKLKGHNEVSAMFWARSSERDAGAAASLPVVYAWRMEWLLLRVVGLWVPGFTAGDLNSQRLTLILVLCFPIPCRLFVTACDCRWRCCRRSSSCSS